MKIPLLLVAIALLLAPAAARAAQFVSGQAADVVLGQPDFATNAAVSGQPNRFSFSAAAAMDPTTGKVFVSDYGHGRVLRFSSSAAAQIGAFPEAVFGQSSFSGSASNQGGTATANTLNTPVDLFVDPQGRLWVADTGNNRVLGFYLASLLGPTNISADIVLGQPNFTTTASGATSTKMSGPYSVALGSNDVLWVADASNNRVLRFDAVTNKSSGAAADGVLGQPDFTTVTAATSNIKMKFPTGICADSTGRLWVAEPNNRRILRLDDAASKLDGAAADGVIGQVDFNSSAFGLTASNFSSPYGVYLDPEGALWVGDVGNHRAVRFPNAASIATNGTADLVLGQAGFTAASLVVDARTTISPGWIHPGPGGSLFISDNQNHRILRFSPQATPTPKPAPTATTLAVAGKKSFATTKAKVNLKGTASAATAVQVKVGKASFKSVKGGASWRFVAKLAPGKNKIVVQATGPGGTKTVRLKITRK